MKKVKDEIIKELYELCKSLNRPLSMKDLPTEKIPFSYNTILRYGISFKSLNFYKFLFELKDIKCKSCNNKIIYKNKESKDKIFCNRSCAAIYNDKKYIKRVSEHKNKNCKWCSVEIGKVPNSYCSQKCYQNYSFMNNFLDWYYNIYIPKTAHTELFKKFLETIYGYKCSFCGISTHEGERIVLQLEHIDGDHLNNKKENICLLCPNCHSQTDTYKGKNVGKGTRIKRNERYRLGKSY